MKKMVVAICAAIMAGMVLGGLMGVVAWRHNPQEEFHDGHGIRWGPLLEVCGMWTVLGMGACGIFLIAWMHSGSRGVGRDVDPEDDG